MRKTDDKPRILVLDLEVAPIQCLVWSIYNVDVSLDAIEHDWSILSYSAKFVGENKIYYGDTSGRGKAKIRDDKHLLVEIAALLERCSILVGHNIRKYDDRKIRARMLEHGMSPPSGYKLIDTLSAARQAGAFTSNSLKALCDKLTDAKKDDHGAYIGMKLWRACLENDPKAWKVLKRYNKKDILATEELFLRLQPWLSNANGGNLAAFVDSDEPSCPTCFSTNLQSRGTAVTSTGRFTRYRCSDCQSWSRSRINLIPHDVRKTKLTKA